jgi:hypothetical protein
MTGKDVRAFRESLKMKQTPFGKKILKLTGTDIAIQLKVSKIEQGKRKLLADELEAIQKYQGKPRASETESESRVALSIDKLLEALLEQQRTINKLREELVEHGIEIGKLKDRLLAAARSGDIHRLDPFPPIHPHNN